MTEQVSVVLHMLGSICGQAGQYHAVPVDDVAQLYHLVTLRSLLQGQVEEFVHDEAD